MAKQKVLAFSKIIFINILDPNYPIFLIAEILRGLIHLELSHLREHRFKYNVQNYD